MQAAFKPVRSTPQARGQVKGHAVHVPRYLALLLIVGTVFFCDQRAEANRDSKTKSKPPAVASLSSKNAPLPPPSTIISEYGCQITARPVHSVTYSEEAIRTLKLSPSAIVSEEDRTDYELHLFTNAIIDGEHRKTWGFFDGVYHDEKTANEHCSNWKALVKDLVERAKPRP